MAYSFSFVAIFLCAFLLGSEACFRQFLKDRRRKFPDCPQENEIITVVKQVLPNNSFNVSGFNIGWYNKIVGPKFHLNYSDDTLALSIYTIPGVFNESFVPFLCQTGLSIANDSWVEFIKKYTKEVQRRLNNLTKLKLNVTDKDILYTHTMLGPSHPAIFVQKAEHAAGDAYYYQRQNITPDAWPKNKTIYGVSIHPLYGGWFYMGPVIIIEDVKCPNKKQVPPIDVLKTRAKKIELLNLVNGDWRNQKWRDVIPVKKNYTADYLEYRMAYGDERTKWVTEYYKDHCNKK